ncbi:MAG: tetratricopeptide repeat protein [Candidatus Melainabacteria bacterium]|nr:tetratricopeptide repeat protein [Candidatus Melainabacteria bacterium]
MTIKLNVVPNLMKNPRILLYLLLLWSLVLATSVLPASSSDNTVDAIFHAANKFEQMGEINKAITYYKRVVELAPDSEFAKMSAHRLSRHLQGYTSPGTNKDSLKNLPLRERIVVIPPTLDHPAVSSDAIHTVKHVIMRLPTHIYRMLDKAGTVVYLAPNATDKFPEALKNQKMVETKLPLSQENGRTYNQDIYIYEYATTTSTKVGPKRLVSDIINNLYHEIGHAINNCQGNYAADREYMELLKIDVDSISPETKEFLRIYTRATEASAEEEQAEVVAYLLGSRARSALTIGSQFAHTRNFVRRKLSL